MNGVNNVLNVSGTRCCPACGNSDVRTAVETRQFTYGTGAEATELTCQLPIRICETCGFEFTDDEAEDARLNAVCLHLGVMTPTEVGAIRQKYGLSRVEFSRITRIGEASLNRWENGITIQNAAYDNFLFLLRDPANMLQLRQRLRPPSSVGSSKKFRVIEIDAARQAAAKSFRLQPTGSD